MKQWLHYLDVAERGSYQWLPPESWGGRWAKHLQQDVVAAGTEVSVSTVRRMLNAEGLHAWTPRRTPLLTQKHKKSRRQFAKNNINKPKRFWDSVLWSDETKLELLGPMDQRYVWRRRNEAWRWKERPAYSEAWQWLSDALVLLCFLWHWKPAACGGQDGFNQLSGNPVRKRHALCEEAEAWTMIRLNFRGSPGRYYAGHHSRLTWIFVIWRPLPMRTELRFPRNAARSWCLAMQCSLKVTFCVDFGETTCNISCVELFKLLLFDLLAANSW